MRPVPAAALLLSGALLAACGGQATAAAPPTAAGATEAAVVHNGVQVLKVTGTAQLEFLQTRLSARAGVPVRIEFTVVGGVPHNLTLLDGPRAATPTFSSGTQSILVTFAHPGTYHYQCTIHPQSMNGVIIVS